MARLFDDAANQYLEIDSAVVSSYPLTMACWFYTDNDALGQALMGVLDKDVAAHYHLLQAAGGAVGDPVRYTAIAGVAPQQADTTSGYSINTWHHACAVGADSTTRAAFLDGGNKGTNAVDLTPANLDRTSIGRRGSSAPAWYMSGYIAEAAVWSAALTDEEVAILAEGISPLLVRPQNLVFYCPLIRDDDEDIIGGLSLGAGGGPTVGPHCRVIYPGISILGVPEAGFTLSGVTKDKDGNILGSCECFLLKDNLDNTASFIDQVTSNAVTGAYQFTNIVDNDANYMVVAWKDDVPHVFDTTDHVLQPA